MSVKKDEILNRLAQHGSVAQFVAFRPTGGEEPTITFVHIVDRPAGQNFPSIEAAIV